VLPTVNVGTGRLCSKHHHIIVYAVTARQRMWYGLGKIDIFWSTHITRSAAKKNW